MSQQRFVHASGPRPIFNKRQQQSKYRPPQDEELPEPPQNIMHDKRVIRGNTYSKHTYEAAMRAEEERLSREQKERARQQTKQPTVFPQRAGTPPPVSGRKHIDIQTETFLEELSDVAPEKEADTQTDPMMDQPMAPLFMPKKSGVDSSTQIEDNDLFDFDLEVQPILEVLVGKTLEMSMMEVMEEEELANIRSHQDEFEQIRNVELAEVQRLEAEAKRRLQEKTRRTKEEQIRRQARMELEKKIAARAFSQSYLRDIKMDVFGRLLEQGHLYDPLRKEISTIFVPWLLDQVVEGLAPVAASHAALDELIRASLAPPLVRLTSSKDAPQEQEPTPSSSQEPRPESVAEPVPGS